MYFSWKLMNNGEESVELVKERKQVLERVMEKETYNVAKKILDRFGYAGSNKTGPATNTAAAGQPIQHQDKMRSNAANETTAKSDSPRQDKPHAFIPSPNKSSLKNRHSSWTVADFDCEMKRQKAAETQLK